MPQLSNRSQMKGADPDDFDRATESSGRLEAKLTWIDASSHPGPATCGESFTTELGSRFNKTVKNVSWLNLNLNYSSLYNKDLYLSVVYGELFEVTMCLSLVVALACWQRRPVHSSSWDSL